MRVLPVCFLLVLSGASLTDSAPIEAVVPQLEPWSRGAPPQPDVNKMAALALAADNPTGGPPPQPSTTESPEPAKENFTSTKVVLGFLGGLATFCVCAACFVERRARSRQAVLDSYRRLAEEEGEAVRDGVSSAPYGERKMGTRTTEKSAVDSEYISTTIFAVDTTDALPPSYVETGSVGVITEETEPGVDSPSCSYGRREVESSERMSEEGTDQHVVGEVVLEGHKGEEKEKEEEAIPPYPAAILATVDVHAHSGVDLETGQKLEGGPDPRASSSQA